MQKMLDTIIIGGGPAALAAAVYAARQKISFEVLTKEIGGQVAWSSDVENYLGFVSEVGLNLSTIFRKHVEANKVKIKQGYEVIDIKKNKETFIVETNKGNFETKTILIASGKQPRKLDIPGEDKFLKKGVTYCATCDAPVFSGMDVAVIGGGNAALDAALLLEKYASKIHILTINDKLIGEQILMEKVSKSSKILTYTNSFAKEFIGNGSLSVFKFEQNGEVKELKVKGAFVEIGSIPSVNFDKLTKKNQWNEIEIHQKDSITNQTSVSGIFAAGDVTSIPEKQVIVAAGEGVKAILGIFKYLNKNGNNY